MPKTSRNGDRARRPLGFYRFGLELRFQQEVDRMAPEARRQTLAWLRRKPGRPQRVFWEILPTGERRRL
jgi:hypothetical protein